jgi:hypothetical protein
MTAGHGQAVTHHYLMHFPEHPARTDDPHYKDFEAFRRRTEATARCQFVADTGIDTECVGGLELHHTHIEFSLQNGVDLAVLERFYPGVSNAAEVGAWVESADNLTWYCAGHHRGHGGIHTAAAADFDAQKFVRGLIS